MPDLQFHFSPGWSVGYGTQRPVGHGFAFWPALLRPESCGYLALRSPDPFTPPLIQPFNPGRFAVDRMVPDAASAGTH
jgi:choline dehydrogenase-like flavoprotein